MVTVIILQRALEICPVLDLLFKGKLGLVLAMLLKIVLLALDELLRLE